MNIPEPPFRITEDYAVRIWRAPPEQRTFGKVKLVRYADWFTSGPPPFSVTLDNRTTSEILRQRSQYYYTHSYIELYDPEYNAIHVKETVWPQLPPLFEGLTGFMYNELSDNRPDKKKLLLGPTLYFDEEADAVEVALIARKLMDDKPFTPLTLQHLLAYGVDY